MNSTALHEDVSGNPREPGKPLFPFLDLKAQFACLRDEIMAAMVQVMESQQFILGGEVQQFETEIAAKLQVQHAVGCASGTDALILALMAAGIGAGDEVVTTPFSFVATAGAIVQVGAKPVFVDIDPATFNLDPKLLEAALTPKTRAILPVHLFGLPAEMDAILEIAGAHKLLVIEDAAQAIGAKYKERCVGGIGDFGCFSFFPSKNLGAAGDGGLITTNNSAMAERLRMIRVHGSSRKYFHEMQGINSRLDALQAAILRVKLRYLDGWAAARAAHAERYRGLCEARGLTQFISSPARRSTSVHVYNQFTIRAKRRDGLKSFLAAAGIPSEIYYPLCLHLQKAFSSFGFHSGQFPVAEQASREVLSLPVFPELRTDHQDAVMRGIAEFYESQGKS